MTTPIARRSPVAVKELEALQQRERTGAGESEMTTDDFLRLLRDDIHQDIISRRLDSGGVLEAIDKAEDDLAVVEERVAALLSQWKLDDPTQWSRYEMPGMRHAIAQLCASIEGVFTNHRWNLPQAPVVGTLTTGQVSAATQKSASGAPLILIDNGFFKFSGIMSQLAIFTTYDIGVHGGYTDGSLQLVADLAATKTVLNTCLYLFKRSTPPQFEPQVTSFQKAISTFVIAHEYAHISAGDLDAHPFHSSQEGRGRRAKEFEADTLGFITAVETADDPRAGIFGPFLLFAGLDLLDRAAAAYQGQPASFESQSESDYPTPFERTTSLLSWLETSPYVPQYKQTIREAGICYNVILGAWDQILSAFWAAREGMALFDASRRGPLAIPEADAFALVQLLWHHVQAERGRSQWT